MHKNRGTVHTEGERGAQIREVSVDAWAYRLILPTTRQPPRCCLCIGQRGVGEEAGASVLPQVLCAAKVPAGLRGDLGKPGKDQGSKHGHAGSEQGSVWPRALPPKGGQC